MVNDNVFNFIFDLFLKIITFMKNTTLFSFHGYSVTIWGAMVSFLLFSIIMYFFFAVFGGDSDE